MPDNKKRKRVVVAMSGGVDSSVAAAVCAKQGYDVIGVTLQLYKNDVVGKKKGSCCAGQDMYDAKKVANKIGIKHYVLDYEEQFKSEVIDDFTNSYANGLTPIPCVRCNEKIKFRDLYQTAKQLDASTLITGHYVSNKFMNGERALFRARDASKDQSYFMFTLKREQLDFIRFPLGDLTKEQTREIARELDLSIAEKDNELKEISSVVTQDNIVRDSLKYKGIRVLTFSSVIKYNRFPINDIIIDLMNIGEKALGCPVELEFAVNINSDIPDEFCLLQIKPMVIGANNEDIKKEIAKKKNKDLKNNEENHNLSNVINFSNFNIALRTRENFSLDNLFCIFFRRLSNTARFADTSSSVFSPDSLSNLK